MYITLAIWYTGHFPRGKWRTLVQYSVCLFFAKDWLQLCEGMIKDSQFPSLIHSNKPPRILSLAKSELAVPLQNFLIHTHTNCQCFLYIYIYIYIYILGVCDIDKNNISIFSGILSIMIFCWVCYFAGILSTAVDSWLLKFLIFFIFCLVVSHTYRN